MNTQYIVKHSPRRRRIALRVNAENVLEILAPCNCPPELIRRIVSENALMIRHLFEKAAARPVLEDGAMLWYLGERYPLCSANTVKVFDGERFLVPPGSRRERLSALENIYRDLAAIYIIPRTEYLAGKFGIPVRQIRINNAKGRWGSCSAKGNINFSWRLIRAEAKLVDSVICHELAHRKVMDHSPDFYAFLTQICPEYRLLARELKVFSGKNPCFI